ncbi:MAG: NADPH-dependent oxidoreductase [Pseudonocardiaceae bacterium]|nr:NADPH-dependent oxidoreductase [Pseudonocardiaceae bacterium]
MQILAIVGSPSVNGRSLTAVRGLLAGSEEAGASSTVLELASGPDPEKVQDAMEVADAVVFASPTYRARASALLKELLEATQRGLHGETRAPLQGKAAAIVQTGASAHHFLGLDDLRSVLAGFFAAQVLAPGLYLEQADYVDRDTLRKEAAATAAAHGRALVALAAAVRNSEALTMLRPQV